MVRVIKGTRVPAVDGYAHTVYSDTFDSYGLVSDTVANGFPRFILDDRLAIRRRRTRDLLIGPARTAPRNLNDNNLTGTRNGVMGTFRETHDGEKKNVQDSGEKA